MTNFFQDSDGNHSMSRLIAFIVVMVALLFAGSLIYIGYKTDQPIMLIATAAGTIFTTLAGPALFFLFGQKKSEIEDKEKANNFELAKATLEKTSQTQETSESILNPNG